MAALAEILPAMTREAQRVPRGTWVRRELGHGARLALKVDDEDRRVLVIGRTERPETPAQWTKWASEVATFLRHFHAEHWQPLAEFQVTRGIAAGFRELYKGEIAPGKALCADCKAPVPFDPMWGAQRCERCVRRVSQHEAQVIQQGRQS